MKSFSSRDLGLVALLSLAVSSSLFYWYHQKKLGELSISNTSNASIANNKESLSKATLNPSYEYPEEIKQELYSRICAFFGQEGFDKIRNSRVIVVGLGGVGSHCAHLLARSGVQSLRLIDFDNVSLSSLNRHAVAKLGDVGRPKVEVLKKHLKDIVPWIEIEDVNEMFIEKEAHRLIRGTFNKKTKTLEYIEDSPQIPIIVIDCIDDVNTKAYLLSYCLFYNLPVLTSMGAGGKADPTRLRISSLSDVTYDPLATKMKWKLKKTLKDMFGKQDKNEEVLSVEDQNLTEEERKKNEIINQKKKEKELELLIENLFKNITCIYSIEKNMINLLPLTEEQLEAPNEFGAVDYMRLRIIPVLGTTPSIFGLGLASYTLCKIADKLYDPEISERMSKNLKHKVRQVLKKNEKERFNTEDEINLDDDDMEFLIQQVWRSRCASTAKRFGGQVVLTLIRWDDKKPCDLDNLILLTQPEANRFIQYKELVKKREEEIASGKPASSLEPIPHVFSKETIAYIEERLNYAKKMEEDSYKPLPLPPLLSSVMTL